MNKLDYHKITVSEMAPHIHKFLPNENKVEKIVAWLSNWIKYSLDCGKIKPYDILPLKGDLACHIGVSQSTIQNAFRIVEDLGLIESKQKIGTYISDIYSKNKTTKLTSKRELVIEVIKKYIKDSGYRVGDNLISTRNLALMFGISASTINTACLNLIEQGILGKNKNSYEVLKIDYEITSVEMLTLVEKLAKEIELYIQNEFKPGEKLPNNEVLAKKFKTSIKTVHDAIKILSKEGIVHIRRGRYGTIVLGKSSENRFELYDYEKVYQKIKTYIVDNAQVGDKLLTISEFANYFNTSTKTIKKALDILSEDGYITFSRGRYGGIYVLDIPQQSTEAYKWIAISSDYVSDN